MAKFKIKYVTSIFCPKLHRGDDWKNPPDRNYELGNIHTDTLNIYMYHKNSIGLLCSDFLDGDSRKYKKAKFSESEASILLLKKIEQDLKEARRDRKQLLELFDIAERADPQPSGIAMLEYRKNVNDREILFNERQAKIWRKKVREIKKRPEYIWEQLSK
jgi:hypothetical protein